MISVVVPRELNLPYENNVVTCPTDKITYIENNSKFSNLSNPDKLEKNAESARTEHGGYFQKKATNFQGEYSPHANPFATTFPIISQHWGQYNEC